ncbi:MAG: Uma2 family endonuclease, partial [Planctomycetaceae bacterium]
VLDGELLVTPAPGTRHQRIALRLVVILHEYIEANGLGELFYELDLLFAPGQYLRPDLLFVPAAASDGITERGVECTPGLVVEVLSPQSGSFDLVKKPRRYADFGVPEYWVADPWQNMILRFDLQRGLTDPSEHRDRLEWRPSPEADPLVLEVQRIFR